MRFLHIKRHDLFHTDMYDTDGNLITRNGTLREVLEEECLKYGSTLEGRMNCFQKTLHIVQKPSILLSEVSRQLFLPTHSIDSPKCALLSYQDILFVRTAGPKEALVRYMNGHEFTVSCDIRTIRSQMKRCRQFLDYLSNE